MVNVEAVELLQRMVPNDDEVKAYREFDAARKDVSELTEEDKVKVNFMYFRDLIKHLLLFYIRLPF